MRVRLTQESEYLYLCPGQTTPGKARGGQKGGRSQSDFIRLIPTHMSTAEASTSPKGKSRLTDEERADRKRKRDQEAEERAKAKALKKEMTLTPVPQVKTITVSGNTLFYCLYTGIPTDKMYSIPSNGKGKGSFLNPAVAVKWLEETQPTSKYSKYRDLIVKDVQNHGIAFRDAQNNDELTILGGHLSIDEYKAACGHQEYLSKSDGWECFRTVDQYLAEKEDNKKSKGSEKNAYSLPLKKPKIYSLKSGTSSGDIEQFDCNKHDTPVVAVAIKLSKAYEMIKTRLDIPEDTPISEVPLLNELEECPNADLIVITDPEGDKDVKSFEKYLADLANNKKKSKD